MKIKNLHNHFIHPLINSLSLLLGIGAGLIAIHLTLTWKTDNANLFCLSLVFWFAVVSLVYDKREYLKQWHSKNSILFGFLGSAILLLVLLKSRFLTGGNAFLSVYPFVSAIGISLIGFGLPGFRYFWKEITLLFFLGIPKIILIPLLDISPLTAKFGHSVLWSAGIPVSREGVLIHLSHGSVEVYVGCNGMQIITYLLGTAMLLLLYLPVQGFKRFIVPIFAVAIAFIVNGFRVALMALLVNAGDRQGFDYWHEGQGSLIFSLGATILLGLFYWFLLNQETRKSDAVKEV
ncbi:MAG: cyanoexosortase A [Cyanobacteria bacterium J06639_14]